MDVHFLTYREYFESGLLFKQIQNIDIGLKNI
mgnify:FL=1